MKYIPSGMTWRIFSLILVALAATAAAYAQNGWPRAIVGADGGVLYVYQLQADSFAGNILRFKAPVTYIEKGKDLPRYGSFQALATVDIDKDKRVVSVLLANVLLLSISGPFDSAKTEYIKETLECGIPAATIDMPLDELICSLQLRPSSHDQQFANQYGHIAPHIIVATRPSILVLMDGAPQLQIHPVWGIKQVVNTPNTILESEDGWFYLYGGHQWYLGPSAGGPFNVTGYIAPDIRRAAAFIEDAGGNIFKHTDTLREGAGAVMEIIVSTSPAELIQTRGKPAFQKIPGTGLQYVVNTNNDIFLDSVKHEFYALLSGRWYKTPELDGAWQYIASQFLPADFRKIPEGSPKDNVLACIAGTDAAREAIVDALLPQTAVVSRSALAASITYEGPPRFTDIPGTRLQYAVNTAAAVFRLDKNYYCVDRGVWFGATNPAGPWKACTERPEEIESIPPSCPLYFCKYLYIFGTDPHYIYTGYSSGYLNGFVDGATIIYGTGHNYPVYTGKTCYYRPSTWGFGMSYNPWLGWCLGDDLDPSWFDGDLDNKNQWSGGYWGASDYRPPYIWHHFSGHGLYQQDIARVANIAYSNNIYLLRSDKTSPSTPTLFYTDSIGDVFMRQEKSQWLLHTTDKWEKVTARSQINTLDAIERKRKRGEMRINNFRRQKGS